MLHGRRLTGLDTVNPVDKRCFGPIESAGLYQIFNPCALARHANGVLERHGRHLGRRFLLGFRIPLRTHLCQFVQPPVQQGKPVIKKTAQGIVLSG